MHHRWPCLLYSCLTILAFGTCRAAPAGLGARVVMGARDLPHLATFYTETLRLPVIARDSTGSRLLLDAGGTLLILEGSRAGRDRGDAAVRILFPAENLDAHRFRLRSLAIPFREVFAADSSLQALLFDDVEGNPIGFVLESSPASGWLNPLQVIGEGQAKESPGRVGLMVYGGLYGIWLGVAVPVGLGADRPGEIGLPLMVGGPLGVWAAHRYASATGLTKGQAATITLAGNLGTWQGLGWAGRGDARGRTVVLTGASTGLVALLATSVLVPNLNISEGQSTVLYASTGWGTWYGFVAHRFAKKDGDGSLAAALLGSTAGFGAGALWSLSHDIPVSRARLISLGGLLGTAVGFGMDLVIEAGDSPEFLIAPTIGGLAGIILTTLATRRPSGRTYSGPDDLRETNRLEFPFEISPARDGGWRLTLVRRALP